jgi:hypothetical protein
MNKLTNNNSVFYLKFKVIEDKSFNDKMDGEIITLFKEIMESGDEKYVAFGGNEKGGETLFLFVDKLKVDRIIKFSNENGILESVEEVSDDVLMGRIESSDFNDLSGDITFESMLDSFISKNLTVDTVLDKINERGMDSLKSIDYDVLNRVK